MDGGDERYSSGIFTKRLVFLSWSLDPLPSGTLSVPRGGGGNASGAATASRPACIRSTSGSFRVRDNAG
jgi:hypothetical protein